MPFTDKEIQDQFKQISRYDKMLKPLKDRAYRANWEYHHVLTLAEHAKKRHKQMVTQNREERNAARLIINQ